MALEKVNCIGEEDTNEAGVGFHKDRLKVEKFETLPELVFFQLPVKPRSK